MRRQRSRRRLELDGFGHDSAASLPDTCVFGAAVRLVASLSIRLGADLGYARGAGARNVRS